MHHLTGIHVSNTVIKAISLLHKNLTFVLVVMPFGDPFGSCQASEWLTEVSGSYFHSLEANQN